MYPENAKIVHPTSSHIDDDSAYIQLSEQFNQCSIYFTMSKMNASSRPIPSHLSTVRGCWHVQVVSRRTLSIKALVSLQNVAQRSTDSPFSQHASSSDNEGDLGWRTDFQTQYVRGKLIGQGSFGAVRWWLLSH